jgi:hypothetical protein
MMWAQVKLLLSQHSVLLVKPATHNSEGVIKNVSEIKAKANVVIVMDKLDT